MRKSFPATMEALREMMQFVVAYAARKGLQGNDLSRIELVAEETLVNIVSYAYEGNSGMVDIDCADSAADKLEITVRDQGKPFNPLAQAPDVDTEAPLDQRTYGGYGIFLIRKIMDEVHYQRSDGSNVLRMVKYLK